MADLTDLRIADYLEQVASTAPSPGAGSTAALALALGIACARKAIRISALHNEADSALPVAEARLQQIGAAALAAGARDADGFARLIEVLKLPHATAAAAEQRRRRLAAEAAALVAVAEELIRIGDEVRLLVLELRDRLDPIMINDVNAALTLVESNRRVQTDNAAENRRYIR